MNFYVAVSQHDKTAATAACPVADGPWRTHLQMITRMVEDWRKDGIEVRTVDGQTMRHMMERTPVKL